MPYNFHVKRLFSANCRPRPLTINPRKLNRFWFVEFRFQRNLFASIPRQLNLTHKCNKISKINGTLKRTQAKKQTVLPILQSSYRLTIIITHIRKNVFCPLKACTYIHSAFGKKPNFFAFECGPLSSMWVANWKVFCEEYQKQFFAFISTLTSKQELLYHILQKHFQHCVICNEFRNEAVNMSKNVQKIVFCYISNGFTLNNLLLSSS